MEIIVHRINYIKDLINLPTDYGVEVDLRSQGSKLILNHEPFKGAIFLLSTFYLIHQNLCIYLFELVFLNFELF